MSICLCPVIPSQGCGRKVWKLQCPQPPLDKASSFPVSHSGDSRRPGQRGKDARGERLQASGQDVARPSPPQRGCSRACTRAAVLQSAGRAAPVAPHPRAWVSAPSASRCSSAGAGGISATPHPLRTLSLLGVSAAASETRRRLCEPRCPARLRRSPGGLTSALGPALTWFRAWRGSVTAPGRFVRRPSPPERCTGGRPRGSSTLL
jgi:hypothetical protein